MGEEDPTILAMDDIAERLKEGFGPRCEDFHIGCVTCASWRAFDDLSQALGLIDSE